MMELEFNDICTYSMSRSFRILVCYTMAIFNKFPKFYYIDSLHLFYQVLIEKLQLEYLLFKVYILIEEYDEIRI